MRLKCVQNELRLIFMYHMFMVL